MELPRTLIPKKIFRLHHWQRGRLSCIKAAAMNSPTERFWRILKNELGLSQRIQSIAINNSEDYCIHENLL